MRLASDDRHNQLRAAQAPCMAAAAATRRPGIGVSLRLIYGSGVKATILRVRSTTFGGVR